MKMSNPNSLVDDGNTNELSVVIEEHTEDRFSMKLHDKLDQNLIGWMSSQPCFFVASAPLSGDGHINLSPRGITELQILDSKRVGFLDLTGSGNETAAHIQENGRLTIMFCAFNGEPRILRLYGRGKVVLPDSEKWSNLRPAFGPPLPGERQLILLEIERIQSSCGFGVPLMTYQGQRDTLLQWAQKRSREDIRQYQTENNAFSIDGLPSPFLRPEDEKKN